MTRKQHVDHWLKDASESLKDMRSAMKSKRRVNALFCGHLAVEKMLKALCVAKNIQVVKEHRLHVLSDIAGLTSHITDSQRDELMIISRFNIEARYADYKQRFYEACTPKFADEWSKKITLWYKEFKNLALQERAALPNNESDSQAFVK